MDVQLLNVVNHKKFNVCNVYVGKFYEKTRM